MRNCARCRQMFEPSQDEDALCPACHAELGRVQQKQSARPPLSFWLYSPTILIILVNTLVFFAMVLSGASFLAPSAQTLLRWGANFGPYTLGGQWWRLLTSAFLHAGILHLALNMWALFNLGLLAELLFGRINLLLLYLFCALGGSIASVWWHSATIGVGASGAIFGVAGALLPALAFQRNRRLRAAMRGNLGSIALFVLYNIAFGAAASRIDNSAHLGGLFIGIILGALLPSGPLHERRAGVLRAPVALVLASVLLFAAAMSASHRHRDEVSLYATEKALRSGNTQQALQEVQRTLRLNPNLAEAHYLLGSIYLQRDALDDALGEFKRTVALKPELADGYTQLCRVYLLKQSLTEALASCQKAVTLDPKDAENQSLLGRAEIAAGDYAKAVQFLQKATEAQPDSADYSYYLAFALLKNGEKQKAEMQLDKTLRINPNYAPARELLDYLKSEPQ